MVNYFVKLPKFIMRTYDGFRFLIRKELNAVRGCGIEKNEFDYSKLL